MKPNDPLPEPGPPSPSPPLQQPHDAEAIAAVHAERHRLLDQVADWAHAASVHVGKTPDAKLPSPEGCSMSTAFALLAEGAGLLADLGRSRATPIEDFQAEYWFDMRTFGLADGA